MKKLTKKQRQKVYLEMAERISKHHKEIDFFLCCEAKDVLSDFKIKEFSIKYDYMFELLPELADFTEEICYTTSVDTGSIIHDNIIRQTILAFCLILTE